MWEPRHQCMRAAALRACISRTCTLRPKPCQTPSFAAQVVHGPKSHAVARTLCLLAGLHLQRWELCRCGGSDAGPAHLLRSVNMATSAAQMYTASFLDRTQALHDLPDLLTCSHHAETQFSFTLHCAAC